MREKRAILVNEEQKSRRQRHENGPARKIETILDDLKRGRRFRDQTERSSEFMNFWTSTPQAPIKIARHGPMVDVERNADRNIGRKVQDDILNTSRNTECQALTALIALTGQYIIAREILKDGQVCGRPNEFKTYRSISTVEMSCKFWNK